MDMLLEKKTVVDMKGERIVADWLTAEIVLAGLNLAALVTLE